MLVRTLTHLVFLYLGLLLMDLGFSMTATPLLLVLVLLGVYLCVGSPKKKTWTAAEEEVFAKNRAQWELENSPEWQKKQKEEKRRQGQLRDREVAEEAKRRQRTKRQRDTRQRGSTR